MPELDLDKDRYRVQTPSGRWNVRDKPWQFAYGAATGVFFLGFGWWNRAEIGLVLLLGLTAMSSFLLGMVAALWLKRFD